MADLFPVETRKAVFSDDRIYRYSLKIQWDETQPMAQFIGLNPSTADEIKDDNTVRKCKQFARNWGCGGIVMTNLFAFRSTDPEPMKRHPNPIGEEYINDFNLLAAAGVCKHTVAAWGNHGRHLNRGVLVTDFLAGSGIFMQCFRITKSGQPEHPLYMPYTQPLMDYPTNRSERS